MIQQFKNADQLTKMQYALMVVFGGLAIIAGLAPLSPMLKTTTVTLAFGVTVGLWLSHLLTMLQNAVDEVGA
jgi:Flp pilus assembly pilin Flp